MTPSVVDQASGLAAGGRVDEAATLLIRAADAGEADALYTLAFWRISGQLIRRDLAAARALMERAGAAGIVDARLYHAYFLANGTGGAVEWARATALLTALATDAPIAARQLALLGQMALDADGNPSALPELKSLTLAPDVRSATAFLTSDECAYLLERGAPRFARAVVVDPRSGRTMVHPERVADFSQFGIIHEDLVVSAINRRIAALSGTGVRQGEALELLRYGPGGEYRKHTDAFAWVDNQRIVTVLLYLTDDYEGGETHFPKADLTFRGKRGDALLFHNVTSDGAIDRLSEHAGLPVRSGTKVIASRWIRARDFAFPQPQSASRRF